MTENEYKISDDLIYKKPDFDRMKQDDPHLYEKYEAAKNALKTCEINLDEKK